MGFRLGAYLDRIGLTDVPGGAAGLAAVQAAQMRAIAFENIDPLLGQVPSLAEDDLMAKLIAGGRGGYCFEQNAILGLALRALGYAPRPHLARVRNGAPKGGTRSHQLFTVPAEGEVWLCDAGFGGQGALCPVPLRAGAPMETPNGSYRVRQDAAQQETVLERLSPTGWVTLYGYDTAPVRPIDLEAANFLCARWDGAPFPSSLMVAFHGAAGRIGLFNRALTLGLAPDHDSRLLRTAAELEQVLCGDCGLALPGAVVRQVWDRIKHIPPRPS